MSWTYAYPHPAVTVDVVIFSIVDDALSVLLIRRGRAPFEGAWALPGGFVDIDESLKRAALRELREETGLRAAWLEQLYTFGHPQRDPRERVISVAYFALVAAGSAEPQAGSDASDTRWFAVDRLPELAFDHNKIVAKARERIREKAETSPIALQLLPNTFTLPELQRAAECVLGRRLDRRNFRKRILGLGVIEATGATRRDGPHRPARLFKIAAANH